MRLLSISEKWVDEIFNNFTQEITKYMIPKPAENISETMEFIRNSKAEAAAGNSLVTAITLRSSGEFLGCCGFHGRKNVNTPELGLWVKKSAHGHGYGKEAIYALKDWADKNVDYEYLIYPVDRNNLSSCRIPISLGGVVMEEKLCPTMWGGTLDELVFRIEPSLQ